MELDNQAKPLGSIGRTTLGVYMVLVPLMLGYFVFQLWPDPLETPESLKKVALFGGHLKFTPLQDVRLILLAMAAGAMGSYIHSATSFADFVGGRNICRSWSWWYVLRTFIGMALALVFYFVIRGGLTSGTANPGDINPFGVTAMAGLVGMFSRQATDKLAEVASTVFQTSDAGTRKDKLDQQPKPAVTVSIPTAVLADSGETIVTLPAADLGAVGETQLPVVAPTTTTDGDISSPMTLEIVSEQTVHPLPVLTSIAPTTMPVGSADTVITLNGQDFVEESLVQVGGAGRPTTFVSETQLTATLPATDFAVAGELPLTVFTPIPGGGLSAANNLKVQ